MKISLRDAAENQAGTAFSEEEYQAALPTARRKLTHISQLNGTPCGEDYLAVLIAETVSARRFTWWLDALCELKETAY